ncbi:MAG: hypothetical protein GAK45_00103 [Pseudomonas citronellolis]|nr:MAG: hypothetical protein GAK45_00103 [Pseudomonas citronellolis]
MTQQPTRARPPMASHRLDLPSICDICGKARSSRKHQRCSRIRQRTKMAEWAEYMATKVADKLGRKAPKPRKPATPFCDCNQGRLPCTCGRSGGAQ